MGKVHIIVQLEEGEKDVGKNLSDIVRTFGWNVMFFMVA